MKRKRTRPPRPTRQPPPSPPVPSTAAPESFRQRLFAPVDIASIAVFRVAFGLLMLWDMLQYLGGWLESYLVPPFLFKYPGFEWVERASPAAMKLIFVAMAIAAVLIALGLAYRAACAAFFVGHTYMLLLDTAQYQNHLYLISLLAFLLILIPAHGALSLDARRNKHLRSATIPAWCLWLLRFQVGIPYFYGGLAKLNSDWLLRAQPMRLWLVEGAQGRLRLPFLREAWAAYGICWGGLIFDLLIVPALLWRRTRIPALVLAALFHLTNSQLFEIGVFPWLMLAALGLYVSPDWPRRWGLVGRSDRKVSSVREGSSPSTPSRQRVVLAFLASWLTFQLLVPFRHYVYGGNVDWTERGHRFSWRMKLRDKRGEVKFVAIDSSSRRAFPLSDLGTAVSPKQLRMMEHDPEMMRQLAHVLAARLREAGRGDLEVHAITAISLNGHPKQHLVDPAVDLARLPSTADPASWIEPLRE
jgi:vitamin K-dependent gamma-carboxylase-like protein